MNYVKTLGRRSQLDYSRALFLTLQLVEHKEAPLYASKLAEFLDIETQTARELFDMLLMVSDDAGEVHLPLYLHEEEDDVALEFVGSHTFLGLWLSEAESIAALSALLHVGYRPDDKLVDDFAKAVCAPDTLERLQTSLRANHLQAALDASQHDLLKQLVALLQESSSIQFEYIKEEVPEHRELLVQNIYMADSFIYLTGIDLTKQAYRSFRLDRIQALNSAKTPAVVSPLEDSTSSAQTITLYVYDWQAFQEINWNNYKIVKVHPDFYELTIEYFGGMWLPARLAAMGNMIEIKGSPELSRKVKAYAQGLLEHLQDLAHST